MVARIEKESPLCKPAIPRSIESQMSGGMGMPFLLGTIDRSSRVCGVVGLQFVVHVA